MLSLFSLLYGDALEAMGYNTQGAAVVLSTMLFVSNFGGPIAGAIVKLTSARIVSVAGACSCTLGIFLSGFSTNIWQLMFTYGVLLGKKTCLKVVLVPISDNDPILLRIN